MFTVGSPPQSTRTELVLDVLDVNEHAPEFIVPDVHLNSTHSIHLNRLMPFRRVFMKVCPLRYYSSTRCSAERSSVSHPNIRSHMLLLHSSVECLLLCR